MFLNNRLSNAIKYSVPIKRIYITINQESLSIKDEGIGIAKDKLDSIFRRFTRANSYAGGFGVGLSIVDSIAKEYGYIVDINSQENIGTEVIIKFN